MTPKISVKIPPALFLGYNTHKNQLQIKTKIEGGSATKFKFIFVFFLITPFIKQRVYKVRVISSNFGLNYFAYLFS